MLRRDFIFAAVSVSLAPKFLLAQQAGTAPVPAPVPWTLGLSPRTPIPHTEAADAIAEAELHFFTPQQMATLTRLSDVLLPPLDGKPGAILAETPLFLDFLIGSSPAPRKKVYSGGLDWLNAESLRLHKLPFAKLDDTQADTVIKPWLRTWLSDHPPTEPHADFINIAHDEIRAATVNSPAWHKAPRVPSQPNTATALYWYPIQPDLRGQNAVSARIPTHTTAAPKSAHPVASYPHN